MSHRIIEKESTLLKLINKEIIAMSVSGNLILISIDFYNFISSFSP